VDLFERIRRGDLRAQEILLGRYKPVLKRMAHGRLPARARSLQDTDDIVQSTLISAFNHLEAFEPRRSGSFLAYLRQILSNKIVDAVRHGNRIPEHEPISEMMTDGNRSPLEEALGMELFAAYQAALDKLNPQQRDAVQLRLEGGRSYSEIALEIGSPSANAARMLIERALVLMAKDMRPVKGTR